MTSEGRTWASRSGPATAGSESKVLAAIAAINTVLDTKLKRSVITAATMSCELGRDLGNRHTQTLRVTAPPERHWKRPKG